MRLYLHSHLRPALMVAALLGLIALHTHLKGRPQGAGQDNKLAVRLSVQESR